MKILVNINNNIAKPKLIKSFKVFDLGEVITTIDDLLDVSSIQITDDILPILKITDVDGEKQYLVNGLGEPSNGIIPYYTDDFEKDITIDDLILINSGETGIQKSELSYINVKDLGAVGDGIWTGTEWTGTDDTLAFQAALDQTKPIYIPKGNYIIESDSVTANVIYGFRGLQVNSNTRIFGEGTESTIVMNGITNGTISTYFTVFSITNNQNVHISDLKIVGGKQSYEELLTFSDACAGIASFGEFVKFIKVENVTCEYILGHGIADNSENSYNEYIGNKTNFNSQNGINANGNYVRLINNYGKGNGFGLIEASCGNSIIDGNIAEYNVNAGISVGGFVGLDTNGHGNNNIIVNNICNNNTLKGLNITLGVVDSIISNNNCFKNGEFGIILYETEDKISNNLVNGNNIFDNGISGGVGRQGIFVNSKGNTITNNNFYNTAEAIASLDTQNYGIVIEGAKHGNVIMNNQYKSMGLYDVYVTAGTLNTTIQENPKTKLYIGAGCSLTPEDVESVIAWNGYPIAITERLISADNPSSSKSAILPPAQFYPKGRIMRVVDTKGAAATYNITLAPQTGQKVNGVVDDIITINTNFGNIKLISNGIDNWITI